jgi:hypothetical protein
VNTKLAIAILQLVKEKHKLGQINSPSKLILEINERAYVLVPDEEVAACFNDLLSLRCIVQTENPGIFKLNDEKDCIKQYKKNEIEGSIKEREEIENQRLSREKLKTDISNAERIYRTYRSTRTLAIIGVILSLIAVLLGVAQLFGWLPLKKWPF